jgi:HK97 family phage portal protein
MSNWLSRFFAPKNSTRTESLDSFYRFMSGFSVSAGAIDAEKALRCNTVYSCVDLLSSKIASIPLILYMTESDGDIWPDDKQKLFKLLRWKPNPWQTAYEYWRHNIECILLRGGFLSWINRVNGQIVELVPIFDPTSLTRKQDRANGKIYFSGTAMITADNYMRFDNEPQESFFWVNYRTLDGVNPCSVIRYAAEGIGLALTAENHGARVFKNDATPPTVIEIPHQMNIDAMKQMMMMWAEGGKGENYGMPRIIDGGAKLQRLSMSNEDAQYLETRRFQKEEICGLFRVPPSMVGDSTQGKGWSTLEQQDKSFLSYTLEPYLCNVEQSANVNLLAGKDLEKTFVKYRREDLLNLDMNARTQFYHQMLLDSVLNPNEVRKGLGMNKREGGDEYLKSSNMITENQTEAIK